jgi:hypothetical protein
MSAPVGLRFDVKIPATLRALDRQLLVGCSLVEARRVVEAAGGIFRAIGIDEHQGLPTAVTADWRLDRITVVVERRRVVRDVGIG